MRRETEGGGGGAVEERRGCGIRVGQFFFLPKITYRTSRTGRELNKIKIKDKRLEKTSFLPY